MKNSKKEKRSKKSDKAQLANGAAEIRKVAKELKESTQLKNGKGNKAKTVAAPPAEPVAIPESTRPIEEILRERVTVLPGSIGLKLADATPIEESLRILDWTTMLSDHVGFMIGDVLNFGESKWGDKYTAALNQTGRAKSTLKNYAWVARTIPPERRIDKLTWSHHFVAARLNDKTKQKELLSDAAKQADKTGEAPPVRELRAKAMQLEPRKKKQPKCITSGTRKKRKAKPEPPPYEPTGEEQSKMDAAENALDNFNDALKSGGLFKIVAQCDNKEKQRWVDKTAPIVTFHNNLDKITGYH